MSIDEELGMVYLPVETPTNDFFGGHRPGNNLFAESLVALDLQDRQARLALPVHSSRASGTGTSPCAPILTDITVNGRRIKAVVAADETGLGLHLRSHQRSTGVADRRTSGAEG